MIKVKETIRIFVVGIRSVIKMPCAKEAEYISTDGCF